MGKGWNLDTTAGTSFNLTPHTSPVDHRMHCNLLASLLLTLAHDHEHNNMYKSDRAACAFSWSTMHCKSYVPWPEPLDPPKLTSSSPTCELLAIIDPCPPGQKLAETLPVSHSSKPVAELLASPSKKPEMYVICAPSGLHVKFTTEVLSLAK